MRPSTYVPIQKHTLTKLGWWGEGGENPLISYESKI